MPARKQPRSVAEQVDDEIKTEITDLVSQIAAEEGPAPHAQYVSEDTEVEMWGQQDPSVDHDTLVQQLMQGAVPPELLDPASDRPLAVVKRHPDLAQLFEAPLDAEMATMVATFAEYPFRLSLLAPYTDDPQASVKKSDSLTARWRRRLPAREPIIQPVPVQPAVSSGPPAAPLGAQVPLEASNPSRAGISASPSPTSSPGAPPALPPLRAPGTALPGAAPPIAREQLGGY